MGLDMYLKASRYIGGWSYYEDTEEGKKQLAVFKQIVDLVGVVPAEQSPSVDVTSV